jgi:ribosomal-protein-alanine N-acetyltransferase
MPRPEPPAFTLEPLGPQHAEAMYEVLAEPALHRYLDYGPPESADYLRGLYTRLARGAAPDSGEVWVNEVILVDGVAAGYVQATVVPGKAEAWIAYVLGSRFHGLGLATRASRDLMSRLEGRHGIARWLASVEHDNDASIALLERLGFEQADRAAASERGLEETERLYRRG